MIHSTPGSAWNEIEDIHDQVDAVRQRLLNLERRLARLEARLELEELGLAPEPQPRPRPAARSRRAMMSSLD